MTLLEPIKPITLFTYRCDSRFLTEPLKEMLESDDKYGYIIVDGGGVLFALIQGNSQTELFRYSVSLPKKHHKGGQSSVRFARLRLEARHNYLSKVAEMAIKYFIDPNTSMLNVNGIVLAGSAEFKDQLNDPKMLDQRILSKVIAVVDVAYGFKQGLQQAVELTVDDLKGVSLMNQKKLMAKFFSEISQDTGRYCFGIKDTMNALEGGAVDNLIVWDQCDIMRYKVIDPSTGKEEIIYTQGSIPPPIEREGEKSQKEILDQELLLDWLVENYKEFGCQLEIIQDSTAEGSQFCRGFGGFGGLLRYKMEFMQDNEDNLGGKEEEEEDSDSDLADYF